MSTTYRTDEDARRALGKRPGLPLPRLQLEGLSSDDLVTPEIDLSPSASESRSLSVSISPSLAPSDEPSSPSGQKRSRRPTISRGKRSPQLPNHPKGLVETRKLLAHLLDRFENREPAPDLLELANDNAKTAGVRLKDKERSTVGRMGQIVVAAAQTGIGIGQGVQGQRRDLEEGDEDVGHTDSRWNTESACHLVDQTRGLLILAQRQGLDLFAEDQSFQANHHLPLPIKTRKGRLSSLTSPIPNAERLRLSRPADQLTLDKGLCARLVDILATLLTADGLHTVSRFRPMLPPKALQVACLDLATVLYDLSNLSIQISIGRIIAHGARVMDRQMTDRCYQWLEVRAQDVVGIIARNSASVYTATDVREAESLLADVLAGLVTALSSPATPPSVIYRSHRLLSLMIASNPQISLELLQITAFAPAAERKTAASILATYFSLNVGHNVIARRLPEMTHTRYLKKKEESDPSVEDSEEHHFIPWRISSKDPIEPCNSRCLICESEIHGFCIKCSTCTEIYHLHCLRSPSETFVYEVIRMSLPSQTKIVHAKFSLLPDRSREKLLHGTTPRGSVNSTRRLVGHHAMRLVNLFALVICGFCQEPLWGTIAQGYACLSGCQRFFHASCVDKLADMGGSACHTGQHVLIDDITGKGSDPFTVSHAVLQKSSKSLVDQSCQSNTDLRSFDEIAILYGTLWTQQKILENGVSGATIIITFVDKAQSRSDPLGLRQYIKLYETFLVGDPSRLSAAAADFAHVHNTQRPLGQGYLFSRQYLTFCSALLQSPPAQADNGASLDPFATITDVRIKDSPSFDLADLKDRLAHDLAINDDHLAQVLVNQLDALGLCVVDRQSEINASSPASRQARIAFPVPFLMNASPSVELLVTAIEALLEDLDLSMNEQGLRLAQTHAWPSLLCARYSLERVGVAIVSWATHEDDYLLQIVKRYASRNEPLPGVRPNSQSEKGYQGTSSISIYKGDRARMLTIYAVPWLSALHELDPLLYSHMIYEQTKNSRKPRKHDIGDPEGLAVLVAQDALECLTAAAEARILFSTHLNVTVAWLEDLDGLARKDTVFRALPRLITAGHTWDTEGVADLWARIQSMNSPDGLVEACLWMRVLAVSEVEMPWDLVSSLVGPIKSTYMGLPTLQDMLVAVSHNKTPLSVINYAEICNAIFRQLALKLKTKSNPDEDQQTTLLQSLRLVLKAYGAPAEEIAATSLATSTADDKSSTINKRRRLTLAPRQFDLDVDVLLAAGELLQIPSFTPHILDFITLTFDKATMIRNIDGSLYPVSSQLFRRMWSLPGSVSGGSLPIRVLLRLLAINPVAVEESIKSDLDSDPHTTRERLFCFVLHLATEEAGHAGPNSSAVSVGLIRIFLLDLIEPSAQTVDHFVRLASLLPTHLAAISRCFEEYLARASDEDRLSLLCDLMRVRPALPHWPIISWTALEDLLAEQVAAVTQMNSWRKSQPLLSSSDLSDTRKLRAILVTIGLDMLASGISISWDVAQRFQQHVAATCALPWQAPFESITNLVLPNVRNVLDSPQRLSTGALKSVLVGSLFVPVVINFGNELRKHDFVTQRCLLDILMITFFKHEVRIVELAALGTMQTIADFVALPGSTENRLLAVQILQTALSRLDTHGLLRVSPSIFSVIAAVYLEQATGSGDAALVENCRIILRSLVQSFGRPGLFIQVFKNDAVNSSWNQTSKSLTSQAIQSFILDDTDMATMDALFADLAELVKRDPTALHAVLDSLEKFAASLEIGISEQAAESFGLLLNRVTKHVIEWNASEFKPDSLLLACRCILSRVAPVSSTALIHQIATLLLVSLSRFNVSTECLASLLSTTHTIAAREGIEDTPRVVMIEALQGGLLNADITPISLTAVLKFICVTEISYTFTDTIVGASASCMAILLRKHPIWTGNIDAGTSLSLLNQAATVLLAAESLSSGAIARNLAEYPNQAAQERCEAFSLLLLAAGTSKCLTPVYPIIARATSLCLRACGDYLSVADTGGEGAEMLNTAFSAIRLVSLGDDVSAISAAWARTWPDWQRLLTLSLEPSCVNAPLRTVSHSVFLDLIIFLVNIESDVLATYTETIRTVFITLESWIRTSGTNNAKFLKTKQALDTQNTSGTRPDEVEKQRSSIQTDILASEKLKLLRSRS